jgi:hypothetical protein
MSSNQQLPPDPLSDLSQLSVILHEVYLNHVKAGFTTDQAMQLIIAWYTFLLSRTPTVDGK